MPNNRISEKQDKYAGLRAQGSNRTDACMESYQCKSKSEASSIGCRLDKLVKIQRLIQDKQVRMFGKTQITDEWILKHLSDIAKSGEHEANRVRALELLGKTRRMFIERIEQDGAKTIIVNYGTSPLPPKVSPKASVEAKETTDEGEGVGGGIESVQRG